MRGKALTQEQAQDPEWCHERALRLLAHRARSAREIQQRLLMIGFEPAMVEAELTRLEGVGLIDDPGFAKGYTRYATSVKGSGRRGIRAELNRKGIAPDVVAEALSGLTEEQELERAVQLAQRRTARLRGLDRRKAYTRLSGFLLRRGFDGAVVQRACATALDLEYAEE